MILFFKQLKIKRKRLFLIKIIVLKSKLVRLKNLFFKIIFKVENKSSVFKKVRNKKVSFLQFLFMDTCLVLYINSIESFIIRLSLKGKNVLFFLNVFEIILVSFILVVFLQRLEVDNVEGFQRQFRKRKYEFFLI